MKKLETLKTIGLSLESPIKNRPLKTNEENDHDYNGIKFIMEHESQKFSYRSHTWPRNQRSYQQEHPTQTQNTAPPNIKVPVPGFFCASYMLFMHDEKRAAKNKQT